MVHIELDLMEQQLIEEMLLLKASVTKTVEKHEIVPTLKEDRYLAPSLEQAATFIKSGSAIASTAISMPELSL